MALIRYSRTGIEDAVVCPNCTSGFVHHVGVDIYERHEDKDTGTHVSVFGIDTDDRESHLNKASVVVDTSMTGNPSARRQGLVIHFWCEGCRAQLQLSVAQHKGQTLINFDVAEGCRGPMDNAGWSKVLAFLESKRKIALRGYFEFAEVQHWSERRLVLFFNTKNDDDRWAFENALDPQNIKELESALGALGYRVSVTVTGAKEGSPF